MLKRLLVPIDGGPEAASVLPTASTLARIVGGRLLLLRVVPEDRAQGANLPDRTADAAQDLERVAAELRQDAGLDVDTAVRQGDPATQIVAEILAADADLVVTATHGRSGLQRAVVGSVTERTLERVGLNAEGRATLGRGVVETITAVADEGDADIIMMSTHALRGVARAILGSVADALVRTAGHPVLLVRQETAARLLKGESL